MAQDLFEDSTMTFGEHIEELRNHLWRAIQGIVVAFGVMLLFNDRVVKLIVDPVQDQLHTWVVKQLAKRSGKLKRDNDALPESQRQKVRLEAQLAPQEVEQFAARLGLSAKPDAAGEPFKFSILASVVDIVEAVSLPLADINGRWNLKSYSAQEAFVIYFKVLLGASVIVASPWVFYQLYSFVAVGLYAHERRFVHMMLPFSIALFLSGVALCFFLVFPAMLKFFFSTNEWMDIEPEIRLNEWVGFAVVLMIIFGATFQMPLLMLMLERVGIITRDQLLGKRRMAIFIMFIFAALITPGGDPSTMVFLAAPMCLLFELGLYLMLYFQRRNPFSVDAPLEFD